MRLKSRKQPPINKVSLKQHGVMRFKKFIEKLDNKLNKERLQIVREELMKLRVKYEKSMSSTSELIFKTIFALQK